MNEFETWREEFITCPFCGAIDGDSWEAIDEGTTECHKCDKPFYYIRNIEITYSSEAIKDE